MKKRVLGFSLLELLVVISIVAILAAIAAPNMSGMIKSNRVQSQVQSLMRLIAYGRSEALSRGQTVTICRSNDSATCGGAWSDGWIVFVDGSTVGTVDGTDRVLKVFTGLNGNGVQVFETSTSTALGYLAFTKSGLSTSNGSTLVAATFALCDSGKELKYARAIGIEKSGRAMLTKANSSGVYTNGTGTVALTCP